VNAGNWLYTDLGVPKICDAGDEDGYTNMHIIDSFVYVFICLFSLFVYSFLYAVIYLDIL